MSILLLSPLPPPSGGIARWTQMYLDWCKGSINVEIVNTAVTGNREREAGAKRKLLDEIVRALRIIRETEKKLKKKPELMHLNTSCSKFGIIRDWICVMKAAKASIAIVVHCHCNIEDQLGKGKIANNIFRRIISNASEVLVLNKESQNYINNISDKRVRICPNFVTSAGINDYHQINERIKKIIYVGDVCFSKGSDDIYELAKQFPEKEFIIVGSVGGEMQALDKPQNVILTGRLDAEEVGCQLEKADLFLFPSLTEGFSIALLEAMAKGLPCLATDVGANHDMLADQGGIVVAVHDIKGMVAGIKRLESKEVRKQMSAWNINRVKENYEDSIVMEQIFDVYRSII